MNEIEQLANIVSSILNVQIKEIDRIREDFKNEVKELVLRTNFKIKELKEEKKFTIESEFGQFTKKIIHGPKIEPLYGADVVIEIPKERVIFVQWKKINKKDRFNIRRGQLFTLLELCKRLCECSVICSHSCYYFRKNFCPSPLFCGSTYYALDFGKEIRYIKACDLSFILGTRKSITASEIKPATIPSNIFREKIWNHEIGCKDLPENEKENILEMYCFQTGRIVFLLKKDGQEQ